MKVFFTFRKYLPFWIYAIIISLFTTCDDNGNKNQNEIILKPGQYNYIKLNLPECKWDYMLIKDTENYMLTAYKKDTKQLNQLLYVQAKDTIGIYFDDYGYPKAIYDCYNYIILGHYFENTFDCAVVDSKGEISLYQDLKIENSWDEYLDAIETAETKSGNISDNSKKKIIETSIKSLCYSIAQKLANVSSSPLEALCTMGEMYVYTQTDNPYIIELTSDISTIIQGTTAILAGTTAGLVFLNHYVWWEWVFLPLKNHGFWDTNDGWLPWAEKIELSYNIIQNVYFKPSYHNLSADRCEYLVHVSKPYPDDVVEWKISNKQPDWIVAEKDEVLMNGKKEDVLKLSVAENGTHKKRTHTIIAESLDEHTGNQTEFTYAINQESLFDITPHYLHFLKEGGQKSVIVNSRKEWHVEAPEWCDITKSGLNGFFVTVGECNTRRTGNIYVSAALDDGNNYQDTIIVTQADEEIKNKVAFWDFQGIATEHVNAYWWEDTYIYNDCRFTLSYKDGNYILSGGFGFGFAPTNWKITNIPPPIAHAPCAPNDCNYPDFNVSISNGIIKISGSLRITTTEGGLDKCSFNVDINLQKETPTCLNTFTTERELRGSKLSQSDYKATYSCIYKSEQIP